MGSLSHWEKSFNSVGWFIPPYIQMGILGELAAEIHGSNGQFDQDKLERALVRIYEPIGLAAMVMNRYPAVPIIKDYRETIAEAIEAHFFGLSHVAVGGLVPVIEGAGRRLAQDRGLIQKNIRDVFTALAEDCKQEVHNKEYWCDRGSHINDGLVRLFYDPLPLCEFRLLSACRQNKSARDRPRRLYRSRVWKAYQLYQSHCSYRFSCIRFVV